MIISRGDPMVFLERPISATLLGLAVLAVIIAVASTRTDLIAPCLDVGDVTERPDGCPGPSHKPSRPFGRVSGFALALAGQPGMHVAHKVAQLSTDVDGTWSPAGEAPVVQRPDRHKSKENDFAARPEPPC